MVLVCINLFLFNISTGSFSEVVCEIAKSVCFGLSTNYLRQCLTFNYYYEIPPASKKAAGSDLLSQGRSFLPASAINRGVFEN